MNFLLSLLFICQLFLVMLFFFLEILKSCFFYFQCSEINNDAYISHILQITVLAIGPKSDTMSWYSFWKPNNQLHTIYLYIFCPWYFSTFGNSHQSLFLDWPNIFFQFSLSIFVLFLLSIILFLYYSYILNFYFASHIP